MRASPIGYWRTHGPRRQSRGIRHRVRACRRRCPGRSHAREPGEGPLRPAHRGRAAQSARRRHALLGGHALDGAGGLQRPPVRARRRRPARHPGHAVRRRPARLRGGKGHGVPGVDGARRDVGPGPRRAGRRGDRARDPGTGRQLLRRGLHQPPAPPGVGPDPGDVRRRPASPRRVRRRADPRRAEVRDGLREALRPELDFPRRPSTCPRSIARRRRSPTTASTASACSTSSA